MKNLFFATLLLASNIAQAQSLFEMAKVGGNPVRAQSNDSKNADIKYLKGFDLLKIFPRSNGPEKLAVTVYALPKIGAPASVIYIEAVVYRGNMATVIPVHDLRKAISEVKQQLTQDHNPEIRVGIFHNDSGIGYTLEVLNEQIQKSLSESDSSELKSPFWAGFFFIRY